MQCTYYCVDCHTEATGLCQHCLPAHSPAHTVIQVSSAGVADRDFKNPVSCSCWPAYIDIPLSAADQSFSLYEDYCTGLTSHLAARQPCQSSTWKLLFHMAWCAPRERQCTSLGLVTCRSDDMSTVMWCACMTSKGTWTPVESSHT